MFWTKKELYLSCTKHCRYFDRNPYWILETYENILKTSFCWPTGLLGNGAVLSRFRIIEQLLEHLVISLLFADYSFMFEQVLRWPLECKKQISNSFYRHVEIIGEELSLYY